MRLELLDSGNCFLFNDNALCTRLQDFHCSRLPSKKEGCNNFSFVLVTRDLFFHDFSFFITELKLNEKGSLSVG